MLSGTVFVHPDIDLAAARRGIDQVLEEFIERRARVVPDLRLLPMIGTLRDLVRAGGKRLRPLLCLCGWYAGDGAPPPKPVLRAAASLELFHTFALIHDDIMDASDSRRGHPTAHRVLAALCPRNGEAAERFGVNSAILLGDLALTWSDELLHGSGLGAHQLAVVRPFLDAMRNEVLTGQYLDLLTTGAPTGDLAAALAVVRYKTAKYTVERPLHVGAALAGASRGLLDACSAFALPVGEAFQLRDDLLGVFGDPAITGKSRLDDLRDGKATVLATVALLRANAADRDNLRRLIGDALLSEEGAATVRDIFVATGAQKTVETMIKRRRLQGLAALTSNEFHPAARAALAQIAYDATTRSS